MLTKLPIPYGPLRDVVKTSRRFVSSSNLSIDISNIQGGADRRRYSSTSSSSSSDTRSQAGHGAGDSGRHYDCSDSEYEMEMRSWVGFINLNILTITSIYSARSTPRTSPTWSGCTSMSAAARRTRGTLTPDRSPATTTGTERCVSYFLLSLWLCVGWMP